MSVINRKASAAFSSIRENIDVAFTSGDIDELRDTAVSLTDIVEAIYTDTEQEYIVGEMMRINAESSLS